MPLLRLHHKAIQQGKPNLDVSIENLTSMAGVAVETVSRVISDFKTEGLIEKNSGTILIIDTSRLQKMKN